MLRGSTTKNSFQINEKKCVDANTVVHRMIVTPLDLTPYKNSHVRLLFSEWEKPSFQKELVFIPY